MQEADFFLICLSTHSVGKRGYVQKEFKLALDIWFEKLANEIYLIPVRLEPCDIPEELTDVQYVDLFEEDGWEKLVESLRFGTERLINQNNPTTEAQIELDARRLERCRSTSDIREVHHHLILGEVEGPVSSLLRSFSRISQDIDAALNQGSRYNQRLALTAAEDRLDNLLRELTRSNERYAIRFTPIATQWRSMVADHQLELAEAVEQRQELDNPYIIGVPLTIQQQIFVGRSDISAQLENLLIDRRCPPLLLYGQRRMGKTSLLHNLGRLLPSTTIPLFIDLQGPASSATGYDGFFYQVARSMIRSAEQQRALMLPSLNRETLSHDPFVHFDEWLDEVERTLDGQTVLIMFDEFEALDKAISQGRFEAEAILGWLRHLIQHRLRFKILLAGSHTLEELQHWSSYLINVQVLLVSYLHPDETRQLIEQPVKDFALRYEPEASQRVLELTRGHPFLVQLLCAEIIALKNEQEPAERRLACLADVEAAVPEALSHGRLFFADIENNQIDNIGLELLRRIAAQGSGAIVTYEMLTSHCTRDALDALNHSLTLLLRRDLIETVEAGYRFQVELIRRWFAQSPPEACPRPSDQLRSLSIPKFLRKATAAILGRP
ncbi:MAG: hypothetical protein ETSY1_24440 [Candidatus Entotheonella factor]|uniref:TIR domain-containing protein n=1 Tax=Entotheonella factor TaxID=1429438 RepID=W4LH11_ENTF1|nr:MAG: hypothetical protein ETSY1_24440 [Candidatus Entotheonella factor]